MITSRTPSRSLVHSHSARAIRRFFFRVGFLGCMQPGAQYCTRQRFPPSCSCITSVDNAWVFFKPASPEGRHLFLPVLTLLIHSKKFSIDPKLSLGLEGSYQSNLVKLLWWSAPISGHTYLNNCFNSLEFYSAVHFNCGGVQLGWAWSSWGRSPEVTFVSTLSGCCITLSFTFVHFISALFDIILNFCFFGQTVAVI